ncbi:hypothetical protein [Roseovarius sp. 2305UL8-3]|uniref:hypothetical protein n=1 Tax=Roseovarius conchicola TaxID=3121636 RepID=UPI003527C6AD
MKKYVLSCILACSLSACAVLQPLTGPRDVDVRDGDDQTRPIARPQGGVTTAAAVPATARTVEEFDTTSPEARREAEAASAGGETALGVTIASLGSPSEPGFWLKTPLVSNPAKGRVVYHGTGKSVAVDLIPIDGPKTAGSRMSLPAMRLIEAPLTGLPEVQVFRVSG